MSAHDPERLGAAFRATTYGTDRERFRLGDRPEFVPTWAYGGRTWAVVTAFNPHGRPAPERQNRQRDALLSAALAGREVRRAINGETPYAEPSFVLLDVGLAEARELGRRFSQAAVLWGVGWRVALVWCDGRRRERDVERFWVRRP